MRRTLADMIDVLDPPDDTNERAAPKGLRAPVQTEEMQTHRPADPEVPDWTQGEGD